MAPVSLDYPGPGGGVRVDCSFFPIGDLSILGSFYSLYSKSLPKLFVEFFFIIKFGFEPILGFFYT